VADVTPLGDGRYRVTDGTRQFIAYAAGPPEARWVFVNGRVYVIDLSPRADKPRGHDDELALAAPMPAKVAAVNVTEDSRLHAAISSSCSKR
jgi:hypothetical protein